MGAAEQLEELNRNIIGLVAVVEAYFGPWFQGFVPERGSLEGQDAVAQFVFLSAWLGDGNDLREVVAAKHAPSFCTTYSGSNMSSPERA